MLRVDLDQQTQKALEQRVASEKDARLWRRAQALLLRSKQVPNQQIAVFLNVRPETVSVWVSQYLRGGVEELLSLNYQGSISTLDAYQEEISQLVKEEKVPTLGVLRQRIAEEFGVEIGETGLFKWCKKKSIFVSKRRD